SAASNSAPEPFCASAIARPAGDATEPGWSDEATWASSSSKPWIAVPLASAASAGLTFSLLENSEDRPPLLKPIATSAAILPQGCTAPNSQQPMESSKHVFR